MGLRRFGIGIWCFSTEKQVLIRMPLRCFPVEVFLDLCLLGRNLWADPAHSGGIDILFGNISGSDPRIIDIMGEYWTQTSITVNVNVYYSSYLGLPYVSHLTLLHSCKYTPGAVCTNNHTWLGMSGDILSYAVFLCWTVWSEHHKINPLAAVTACI